MQQRYIPRRGAARARAVEPTAAPWLLATLTALGIMTLGIGMAHSQPAVPEVVKPKAEAPAPDTGRVPDTGVIRPPSSASTTPVIQPPAMGTMPVIPPPGSAGGDRTVVPK